MPVPFVLACRYVELGQIHNRGQAVPYFAVCWGYAAWDMSEILTTGMLKDLPEAAGVDQFFMDDGFHEIRVDEDPRGSWFQICAKKIGAVGTVVSSRKAIRVIIKGEPNKFIVLAGTGE